MELKEQVEGVKDRCAAIIHQAKKRCAANAALSGGIVTLPDRQRIARENLIPQGYLPGKVLPSVISPQPVPEIPDWTRLDEQRKICKAACAKIMKDVKVQTDKKVKTASEYEEGDTFEVKEQSTKMSHEEATQTVPPQAVSKGTKECRAQCATGRRGYPETERELSTEGKAEPGDLRDALESKKEESKVSKITDIEDENIIEVKVEADAAEQKLLEEETTDLSNKPEEQDNKITEDMRVLLELMIEESFTHEPAAQDLSGISETNVEGDETVKGVVVGREDNEGIKLIDETSGASVSVSEPTESVSEEIPEPSPPPLLLPLVEGMLSDLPLQGEQQLNMSLTDEEEIAMPIQVEEKKTITLLSAMPEDTGPIIEIGPAATPDHLTIPRAIILEDLEVPIIEPISKEEPIIVPTTEIPIQLIADAFVPRAASLEEVQIESPKLESKQITAKPLLKDQICGTTKEVCTSACNTKTRRESTSQPRISRRYTPEQVATAAPAVIPLVKTAPPPDPPKLSDRETMTGTTMEEKGTWVCRDKCTVITRSGQKDETIIIADPEQRSEDILENIRLGYCPTPPAICRTICVDENDLVKPIVTSTAVTARPPVEEKGTWVCRGKCTVITRDGGQDTTVVITDAEQPSADILENIHMGRRHVVRPTVCSDREEIGTIPCPYMAGTSKNAKLDQSKICRGVCSKKRPHLNICRGAPTNAKRPRREEKRICTAACSNVEYPEGKGHFRIATSDNKYTLFYIGKGICRCFNKNKEKVMTVRNIPMGNEGGTKQTHKCAAGMCI